ncbi:hypothetical protein LAJ19_20820 (plasmid) [Deinococcus taeanensis]|uniref:hypothetical protein n=1 Tax=Deinococcus taeanensis TaxID=2737050 RepID=UPI001CDC3445|nr:hypothetical protein [Deinococcus taeanensis]UBV45244.1 hypothetical protein LAJ19_20820 [Deinococcus taeanensis]
MNVYLSAAAFGLLGLLAMAGLGLAHGHSPGARPHGGTLPRHPAPHSAPQAGPVHSPHSASPGGSWLGTALLLTSPRVVFSVLLGFGLVGLVLTGLPLTAAWSAGAVWLGAGMGGLAFERWVTGPYWNALMTFQSRPARSLSSTVLSAAQAVTDFDQDGHGLVLLEFEGEIRQLLAVQSAAERAGGLRIRLGDRVRVEQVDEERHRCTVSQLG